MKVGFPHMGQVWVALKTLFDKAGVEAIVPPKTNKRTLSLATKYAPEWICMPFKTNLGNYIEALEMGADTLLAVGGPGMCRLGYYNKVQERVLRDLGYDFEWLIFDWQEKQVLGLAEFLKQLLAPRSWPTIISDIRHGLTQLFLLDDIERRLNYLRPREMHQGSVSRVWHTVPDRICAAHTPTHLNRVKQEIFAELDAIPLRADADPLRVGLLGEFFMALEPCCNFSIEERLGHMGVEVTRGAYISDWAKVWLFLEAVGLGHGGKVKKAARPYLRREVSGDAMQSVGETVLHAKEGFDGIVHIQPFTCMPEIIAQNLLPRVSKEHDIPVISIILDEQTGETGVQTRLEAFVDLMERRRHRRRVHLGGYRGSA